MTGSARWVVIASLVACGRGPAEMEEHCGEITKNETWRYGTHLVTCDVVVRDAHLAIDSGTDVTFVSGASITVEEGGSLESAGTARAPVVLHGELAEPGAWEGVLFYEGADSKRNRLSSTVIRDAGQHANRFRGGALHVHGAEVLVEDVELADNAGMGFVLGADGGFADGSTPLAVHGNVDGPVEAVGASAGTIPLGSDLVGNVEQDAIEVLGTVDRSVTWGAHGVPYLVADTIEVEGDDEPAVLTLAEGLELRFRPDEMLRVGYGGPGALVTQGVLFTTAGTQIAGTWGGIALEEHTVGALTFLTGFEIEWGGSYEGGLYIRQCSPTVANGFIHDNAGCGLYLSGSSAEPDLTGISYSANVEGGYCEQ